MKFLVTKDLAHSRLLAYLMGSVVFAIVLYLVMDMVLHSYVIGSDIAGIHSTLYGNAETFEEPILIDSLLLQVHIDLFMTMFALLILTSVYIRLHEKTKMLRVTVHTLLLLGITSPISLLLAYFGPEVFVYLWEVTFFVWHTLAFVVSFMIFRRLNFK